MTVLSVFLIILCSIFTLTSSASKLDAHVDYDIDAVQNDIEQILLNSKTPNLKIELHAINSSVNSMNNEVFLACKSNTITFEIRAKQSEIVSTAYYALHRLGFLFPHPKWQISPDLNQILSMCGKTFSWKPQFSNRGFHFHTMHPNEWVHGFFLYKKDIAVDTIKWLARNMQNTFSINLLRIKNEKKMFHYLADIFAFSKKFSIQPGIALSIAQQQQKNYKLLSLVEVLLQNTYAKRIIRRLDTITSILQPAFISLSAGTSEFTSTNYKRTLDWLNLISNHTIKQKIQTFSGIHVSTGQSHPDFGNFNYLPQHANKNLGILPHTVMFYGLNDLYTPVYNNTNFMNLKKFMFQEKEKRLSWFVPETSYFIGMDIDVPILLTDYLIARSNDISYLKEHNLVSGHLNFTTGQEIGYWLMDWTVALLSNTDYSSRPLIGLELIGEDIPTWEKIVSYQTKFFKSQGIISMISSSNFLDEVSKKHRVHKRNTLKDLKMNKTELLQEITKLKVAIEHIPNTANVRNDELKNVLSITFLRVQHAYYLRLAMYYAHHSNNKNSKYFKKKYLEFAKKVRSNAFEKMQHVIKNFNRYPSAFIFERHKGPTSYSWGYGYPAAKLHFWQREEKMIENNFYNPLYGNIYNLWKIVF
jgi:hypothetical protein